MSERPGTPRSSPTGGVVALVLALAASLVSAAAAQPATPAPTSGLPPDVESFLARAIAEWKVPGAAIAVVKDGRVIALRAYGVRELGRPEPVDANTIFDAASLTKSFTAAVVATLVDEKKVTWDEPVRELLPTLEFPDPYLTANVTLRDLLSHRTAVRPTNSAWYFTHLTRPEVLGLVRHFELAAPFRTRSVYWNIGYTILGEAAAAVAGQSWEDLVATRFIQPLGLTRTTVDFDGAPRLGNVATPHGVIGGRERPIPRETARASTAPAGAVQTSVTDLATWMLFQLGDGSFRGRRLLSAEALGEMHSPQILFSTTPAFRAARRVRFFAAYGMGWQVFDYRGSPFLWHTGGGDGSAASMALFPELGLGVAVLVNTSKLGSGFNLTVLTSRIADHYLGLPASDDTATFRAAHLRSQTREREEQRAADSTRQPSTGPSRPLPRFVGRYIDRLGLEVSVVLEGDSLRMRYGGGERATLEHWHHDVFRARWENPWHDADHPTFVSFIVDGEAVNGLHLEPFGDSVDARRADR